ncbi:hypothetical protein RFI_11276 [Reticulomyxa filosa]|uniref:Rab-GAP TBC domain-containing protein n=1 Tax=Reticulomyxa filosa TaxID=46433 RepID=X6NKJ0_RETFI|nr:hypothetical protein RFI_11276 [Reticulomyxa filosa]|eukprot:ETO25862.1 hypothetical protein RFI_11276 [Reticulomyxa filosa]
MKRISLVETQQVWSETSGCQKRMHTMKTICPNYYLQLVQKSEERKMMRGKDKDKDKDKGIDSTIEKDLKRTFPWDEQQRNEKTVEMLRRILMAYSVRNPSVGYCQSMNIIGAMLLSFMDEQQAFWMLCSVLEDVCCAMDLFYHQVDLAGVLLDERVLSELIRIKLPRIARHFHALQFHLSTVAIDWFLCLFVTTLPYQVFFNLFSFPPPFFSHPFGKSLKKNKKNVNVQTTLRVWDILFAEGTSMIFRTALALLALREKEILKTERFEDVIMVLRDPCANELANADLFIAVCLNPFFDDLDSLIAQLRTFHKLHNQSDLVHTQFCPKLFVCVINMFRVKIEKQRFIKLLYLHYFY